MILLLLFIIDKTKKTVQNDNDNNNNNNNNNNSYNNINVSGLNLIFKILNVWMSSYVSFCLKNWDITLTQKYN